MGKNQFVFASRSKGLLYVWLAIVFCLPSSTVAAESKEGIYASAGLFFQNMLKVSSGPTASRSTVGETFLPDFVFGYRVDRWFPTLGLTIPGNKGNDGEMKRTILRIDLPYLFPTSNELEWKAGLGYMIYQLKSDGATVSLRNGSSFSNFYVPAGTQSGSQFYLMGGAAYVFNNGFRADVDLLLGGILTTKRNVNLSLRGGYVF